MRVESRVKMLKAFMIVPYYVAFCLLRHSDILSPLYSYTIKLHDPPNKLKQTKQVCAV